MKACVGILAILCAGCASTLNPVEMRTRLHEENPIFADVSARAAERVVSVEQLGPQLTPPFKLAVAPPLRSAWTQAEREEIRSWEEPLKKAGVISELIVIPSMVVDMAAPGTKETILREIHAAAGRFGADVVLVTASVTEVDSYANLWSVFYLTVVGALFVPGTTHDALTVLEGVLIDNRNGYLYAATDAEGQASSLRPLAKGDSREAVRASRLLALRGFGQEFVKQASRLKPKPPGERYETPK